MPYNAGLDFCHSLVSEFILLHHLQAVWQVIAFLLVHAVLLDKKDAF